MQVSLEQIQYLFDELEEIFKVTPKVKITIGWSARYGAINCVFA